jgi:hypothetical protein
MKQASRFVCYTMSHSRLASLTDSLYLLPPDGEHYAKLQTLDWLTNKRGLLTLPFCHISKRLWCFENLKVLKYFRKTCVTVVECVPSTTVLHSEQNKCISL